ncbi:MAG: hypothetical protein IKL21_07405 [Clostridia bacterium]|jgi:hypothetical protein|nr:hypothetical protein [Clostridia bacterium]
MYNSKPKSADKPEKIKKTFAFRPEVAELIETHKYVHRGREVDFVSQAIREYAASIDGEKNQDVLTDRIITSYRACTRNDMNRLSAMVFKIAVELAKANYILGANIIDMTDEEMEELNARARYAVRCNYGFFSIEQAVKEEMALRGYEDDEN